jgi:hypothetical protein
MNGDEDIEGGAIVRVYNCTNILDGQISVIVGL